MDIVRGHTIWTLYLISFLCSSNVELRKIYKNADPLLLTLTSPVRPATKKSHVSPRFNYNDCICYPSSASGTLVPEVLHKSGHNLKRLVVYLYQDTITNQIYVYTPRAESQRQIPDLRYEPGDLIETNTKQSLSLLFTHSPFVVDVQGRKPAVPWYYTNIEANSFVPIGVSEGMIEHAIEESQKGHEQYYDFHPNNLEDRPPPQLIEPTNNPQDKPPIDHLTNFPQNMLPPIVYLSDSTQDMLPPTDHLTNSPQGRPPLTDHLTNSPQDMLPPTDHLTNSPRDRPSLTDHLTNSPEDMLPPTDHLTNSPQDMLPPTDHLTNSPQDRPPLTDHLTNSPQDMLPPTDHLTNSPRDRPSLTDHLTNSPKDMLPPTDHLTNSPQDRPPLTDHLINSPEDMLPSTDHLTNSPQYRPPPTDHLISNPQDSPPPTDHFTNRPQDWPPPTDHLLHSTKNTLPLTDHLTTSLQDRPPLTYHLTNSPEDMLPSTDHLTNSPRDRPPPTDHLTNSPQDSPPPTDHFTNRPQDWPPPTDHLLHSTKNMLPLTDHLTNSPQDSPPPKDRPTSSQYWIPPTDHLTNNPQDWPPPTEYLTNSPQDRPPPIDHVTISPEDWPPPTYIANSHQDRPPQNLFEREYYENLAKDQEKPTMVIRSNKNSINPAINYYDNRQSPRKCKAGMCYTSQQYPFDYYYPYQIKKTQGAANTAMLLLTDTEPFLSNGKGTSKPHFITNKVVQKHPIVLESEHVDHTITEDIPITINKIVSTFDQWFYRQMFMLKNVRPMRYDSINISMLKRLVQDALRKNGIYTSPEGVLIDIRDNILDTTQLKLRPFLIGNSLSYNKLIRDKNSNILRIAWDSSFLEAIMITYVFPTRVLGIIPLRKVYLPQEILGRRVSVSGSNSNLLEKLQTLTQITEVPSYSSSMESKIQPEKPIVSSAENKSGNQELQANVSKSTDSGSSQILLGLLGRKAATADAQEISDHPNVEDADVDELDDYQTEDEEDSLVNDDLGLRIIGGSAATGSGVPLSAKGRRSAFTL